ncbi:glucoamylase [Rhizobium sp. RU20A]|uniref:glycoside hydrolase family 15 protein n=1 Tax=Rhizobium sp. RU20A TaxID=1907412 RepID=UPI00095483B8|nr:glycoside hydrolase family 15 protein [Rhizobium sp. RU20A]SIQ96181.1 glucoamylase [Rhizobium sp. RU20A]
MTSPTSGRACGGAHQDFEKHAPRAAHGQTDLTALAPFLFLMMMRNVTSDGFVVEDPCNPGEFSLPGCVIAAPSYPANTPGVDQNYVFHWVRDAAITALEIAAAGLPGTPDGGGVEALNDYVAFASLCQDNATPTLGHACYTIRGKARPWSEQNDGPGIQSIALLEAFDQLSDTAKATALKVLGTNITYLLEVYRKPTTNLWEEHVAQSFFARAIHLRCLRQVSANTIGLAVPAGVGPAIAYLEQEIERHWNGTIYVSMLDPDGAPGTSSLPPSLGYDPNIDIVSAAIYGAIACDDTRLLATAGELRRLWSDPASDALYPINLADAEKGIGPLLGRYPGDIYDGDTAHPVRGGHPWPLCTANFAELYYRLARHVFETGAIPLDDRSRTFFKQVGVSDATPPADAAQALQDAGDRMMRAIVFHSNHYELSEQFDGTSGFEKSVRNLTWSYAAFLSALRAKQAFVRDAAGS